MRMTLKHGSQSMVHGLMLSPSGCLLETQILSPHLRPTEETVGLGAPQVVL